METPWSSCACQAITAMALAKATPTRTVSTCSSAFTRSENRPQRRRERISSRCSCRCSVWRLISRCWSRRNESKTSSVLPPARPLRAPIAIAAEGLIGPRPVSNSPPPSGSRTSAITPLPRASWDAKRHGASTSRSEGRTWRLRADVAKERQGSFFRVGAPPETRRWQSQLGGPRTKSFRSEPTSAHGAERSAISQSNWRSRSRRPRWSLKLKSVRCGKRHGDRNRQVLQCGEGVRIHSPDDGGADIFVHVSAVERSGLDGLNEGDQAGFDVEQDRVVG